MTVLNESQVVSAYSIGQTFRRKKKFKKTIDEILNTLSRIARVLSHSNQLKSYLPCHKKQLLYVFKIISI